MTYGFDGGQRQWFVMEIYDQQTHALLANVSSKLPIFTVNGLDAGLLLKIVIYATNMRGRSEPILLQAYTLKAAEKQTGSLTRSLRSLAPLHRVKYALHPDAEGERIRRICAA
uniref:Uncharacterized protein n=1 Tax=Anopheles maculatus TaxID=74869 RepID=A0A182SYV5_9DIPT